MTTPNGDSVVTSPRADQAAGWQGIVVLVGPGEDVTAAHIVSNDTEAEWRDAIEWLESSRAVSQRQMVLLVAAGDVPGVRLVRPLAEALAAGWKVRPEHGSTPSGDGLFDVEVVA